MALQPTPHATQVENSNTSATAHVVTLLGAIAFEFKANDLGYDFTWADKSRLANLLNAPEARLPMTSAAYGSLMNAQAREDRRTAIAGLSWDDATYRLTYPIDGFDGSRLWVEERGQRIAGDGTIATHIQAVLRDITADQNARTRVAYSTTHDELTGLWNTARMAEAIDAAQVSSKLRRRPGYVMGIHIPGIDDITRIHGENGRDYLLQIIGGRLKSELTPTDNLARIGPDLFALLLLGASESRAKKQAVTIEDWMNDTRIPSIYGEFHIAGRSTLLPLGVTVANGSEILSLLATQSTSIQAVPKDTPITEDKELGAADILSALENNELELAYQPIVRASDRSLHHYECLLRHNKNDKIVSAWKLILAAEEHGLVHLLDQRALDVGAKTLLANPDIHLAFNVSPGTICHSEAAKKYLKTLWSLSAVSDRITLELTETAAIKNLEDVASFVTQARNLGCRFAIDDFGSGHTTFQNILSLKVDMIKIDGSLVTDMTSSPHKQAFVRMMVDLAQTFGMESIAEMVSNESDAILMERLGVDYFQGYMFGVPSPTPSAGKETPSRVAQG